MKKIKPKNTWLRKIGNPPTKIHITLIKVFRQPALLGLLTTLFPNGNNARMPSLIDCNPKGIPIMVSIKQTLDTKYSRAIKTPPNKNQIRFKNKFIKTDFKLYD